MRNVPKPAPTTNLKVSGQLPGWFGSVSKAIKDHEHFRNFHDNARQLAIELGAASKNSSQLLKAVQARRIQAEQTAVKLVEQSGFRVSNRGEKAYSQVMAEIESKHGAHFSVISACWALEHGLTKAMESKLAPESSGISRQGNGRKTRIAI